MIDFAPLTLRRFWEATYLADRGDSLSVATIKKVSGHLSRWERHSGDPQIPNITKEVVRDFRAAMSAEGLGAATQNAHLASVRMLLKAHGHNVEFGRLFLPERPDIPDVPEISDVERLYQSCELATWPRSERIVNAKEQSWCRISSATWWRALIVTAAVTGFRRADLFALEWTDIDEAKGVVCRRNRKTGKRTMVPLLPCLMKHLEPLRRNQTATIFSASDRLSVLSRQLTAWGNGICLQQLRRFAGSTWERARPTAGQLLLGHGVSDSVTFRYYVPMLEILREAVPSLRLPECFSRSPSSMTQRRLF